MLQLEQHHNFAKFTTDELFALSFRVSEAIDSFFKTYGTESNMPSKSRQFLKEMRSYNNRVSAEIESRSVAA